MILAIDPGVMNGWAEFTDEGEFKMMGQMDIDDLYDFFHNYSEPLSAIIIEDYVLYKKRAIQQSGSNMPASKVIGAAEMLARRKGAKLVKQKANILPIAEKLSQKFMPKDHSISHQFSAYNHGFYYLIQQGLRQPALVDGNTYG